MGADTAEFAQERDETEERRKQYIASTRVELATALRAAEEHLDHAERLTVLLGEGHLYDIEYTNDIGSEDAERFIDDAARKIRAAYRIITSLP
ncbi:hypothetical protein [Williamsia sp. D3]|uniref:hypothetical protein n=1 Tax=Williamsia TaxID=85043 RepID=UPI0003D2B38B|nr:hypothetical protein [Williamsia sp. D3]ETD30948.1 hypothetical protein W823_21790 [Williamsia sp. D3]